MAEAPGDATNPQRDLLEEMHYALGLAQDRERSAKEEMDRLQRLFVTEYSSLEERVRSAEQDAERAALSAAGVEERVNKSLQALRILRVASHLHIPLPTLQQQQRLRRLRPEFRRSQGRSARHSPTATLPRNHNESLTIVPNSRSV